MTAYACPECGAISHSPADLEQRYCGRCHLYAVDLAITHRLEPMDGGWRVKTTDDGRFHLDVVAELHGWVLVTTPVDRPAGWTRGWRYYGHGQGSGGAQRTMISAFHDAVAAARAWDGADSTGPAGYDKALIDTRA